jgi:hypothetical protein
MKDHVFAFHHIGCLTESIEQALEAYKDLIPGKVSPIYHIESQNVKVCFIEQAPGVHLELVQPDPEKNLPLMKHLRQKKHFYHLAYRSANFDQTLHDLKNKGWQVLNTFHSEAFAGLRCSFLVNPVDHLIEIIEMD